MIRNDAIEIWNAGVAAVHGRKLVENAIQRVDNRLSIDGHEFDLDQFDRILVVGGGKFSHDMAEGLENVLDEELSRAKNLCGLVTVPDGSNDKVQLQYVEACECRPKGINLPTSRVLEATVRMVELLSQADDRTLILALISGGGSALLEKSTLPLEDIVAATNWLSLRGANIIELNSVRIAMSEVKGGGLAMAMPAGTMIGLIVSDVPGDDLRFVSSGPTIDAGTNVHRAAREVLDRFAASDDSGFPDSVKTHLHSKLDFPQMRSEVFNFLIGNADVARRAAMEKSASLGYQVVEEDVLADTNTCEQVADAVSRWCAESGDEKQCVVSIGEPVVKPGEGAGQGGRNQHCVLAAADRILASQPQNDFCFLSAGTDGEDGNTTAAGAQVSHNDLQNLATEKSEIAASLKHFDSHPFLRANGMVFESGPTATNVADLRVLLRDSS